MNQRIATVTLADATEFRVDLPSSNSFSATFLLLCVILPCPKLQTPRLCPPFLRRWILPIPYPEASLDPHVPRSITSILGGQVRSRGWTAYSIILGWRLTKTMLIFLSSQWTILSLRTLLHMNAYWIALTWQEGCTVTHLKVHLVWSMLLWVGILLVPWLHPSTHQLDFSALHHLQPL